MVRSVVFTIPVFVRSMAQIGIIKMLHIIDNNLIINWKDVKETTSKEPVSFYFEVKVPMNHRTKNSEDLPDHLKMEVLQVWQGKNSDVHSSERVHVNSFLILWVYRHLILEINSSYVIKTRIRNFSSILRVHGDKHGVSLPSFIVLIDEVSEVCIVYKDGSNSRIVRHFKQS